MNAVTRNGSRIIGATIQLRSLDGSASSFLHHPIHPNALFSLIRCKPEWPCCPDLGLVKSRPRMSIQALPSQSAKLLMEFSSAVRIEGGAPWQPVEKWESDSRQGGCSHPPIRTCLPFRADQTVHPTFSPARRRGLHRPVATATMHEPSRISHGAFRLQNMAWFKKGGRYRCAKHPTNLRSVPGRPGNGT